MAVHERLGSKLSISIMFLSAFGTAGCGDGGESAGEDPPANPFAEAAALEATWCVQVQRTVEGFDETSLPETAVAQQTHTNTDNFVSSRAEVKDGVLQVQALVVPYENPSAPAGSALSRSIACKVRTPEAIQGLLGLKALNPTQTCGAAHEQGFAWALSQLSKEERERYDASGHKLSFGPDIANAAGPQWIASAAQLTANGNDYVLASSALISPGTGNYSDGAQGAVYCKLWTPAQMLYWLQVRAFDANPLANEPKAPEPEPNACTPAMPHTGSCVFLFPVASLHFCEDYTGSGWTADTSQSKCTTRGGTYAMDPCTARKAETDVLDGDGVFKGQCVLKCGTPDEYVWNTYSGAADGAGCGAGTWIPVSAAP